MSKRSNSLAQLLFPRVSHAGWVLWAVGLVVLAVVLWLSPASPTALGRADAMAGRGDVASAANAYDAVALHSPFARQREEALYRGALVYAMDLSDTQTARTRLQQLAQMGRPERAAVAWEQIGHLAMDDGHPREAAVAFRKAWEIDRNAARAPDRLELAARARSVVGDPVATERAWLTLEREVPERRARGLMARAEQRLASGDAEGALTLYEDAVRTALDPDMAAVARLGAATCLERMGDLDQAIVAIDGAELPDGVLRTRRHGMQVRSAMSNGEL